MARELSNWIDSYMQYTENTESAAIYHKWVALYCVASALRRKCWFKMGMYPVHTNLYTVLTGPAGIGRKSKALSLGRKILTEVPDIKVGPNVVASREALYMILESAITESHVGKHSDTADGLLKHCSLSFISDEFETFIGQRGDNDKMLAQLTDSYDCTADFKYNAKNSKSNEIPNLWVSILAATTPTSLAKAFPIEAIETGFARRLLFIWSGKSRGKIAIPEPPNKEIQGQLIDDLEKIATIYGEINYSPEGEKWWVDWYNNYDFNSAARICKSPHFLGWYSVKPTLVIKIAMCCAAAKRQMKHLRPEDFEEALEIIAEMEYGMDNAFMSIGKSSYSDDITQVETIVREHGEVTETKLFLLIWRDIDQDRFDRFVYPTVKKKGTIKRTFKTIEDGKIITCYKWVK